MEKATETFDTQAPITAYSVHPSWIAIAHATSFKVVNRNTLESRIFYPIQPLNHIENIQILKTKPLAVVLVDKEGYVYLYDITSQWDLSLMQEFHFNPRAAATISLFANYHLGAKIEPISTYQPQRLFLNDKISHLSVRRPVVKDDKLRFIEETISQKDFKDVDIDCLLDAKLLSYQDKFVAMCLNDKNMLYIIQGDGYRAKQYLGKEQMVAVDYYVLGESHSTLRVFAKTEAVYLYADFDLQNRKFRGDFARVELGDKFIGCDTRFITDKQRGLLGVFSESAFEVYDEEFEIILNNDEGTFYSAEDYHSANKVDVTGHYLTIGTDYSLVVLDINMFI